MGILPFLNSQIMYNKKKTLDYGININNVPLELHAPGYNFLSLGTKLDKR